MKKLVALLLFSVSLSSHCYAGNFSVDGISLDIPLGFEGPLSQSNMGATVYGFSKASTTPLVRTLLQLTSFDTGKAMPTLSKEERMAASDKYLLDFLGGVERRRTAFNKSEIIHISLGGMPASKLSWSGNLAELRTNGIMYCVIVGNKIISLHTQDAGDSATPNMLEAIKSIETLVLAKQEKSATAPTENPTSAKTKPAGPTAPVEKRVVERRPQAKHQRPHVQDLRTCLDLKTNEEIAKCARH